MSYKDDSVDYMCRGSIVLFCLLCYNDSSFKLLVPFMEDAYESFSAKIGTKERKNEYLLKKLICHIRTFHNHKLTHKSSQVKYSLLLPMEPKVLR